MPSCFVCGRSRNQKSKQELVTFHRNEARRPASSTARKPTLAAADDWLGLRPKSNADNLTSLYEPSVRSGQNTSKRQNLRRQSTQQRTSRSAGLLFSEDDDNENENKNNVDDGKKKTGDAGRNVFDLLTDTDHRDHGRSRPVPAPDDEAVGISVLPKRRETSPLITVTAAKTTPEIMPSWLSGLIQNKDETPPPVTVDSSFPTIFSTKEKTVEVQKLEGHDGKITEENPLPLMLSLLKRKDSLQTNILELVQEVAKKKQDIQQATVSLIQDQQNSNLLIKALLMDNNSSVINPDGQELERLRFKNHKFNLTIDHLSKKHELELDVLKIKHELHQNVLHEKLDHCIQRINEMEEEQKTDMIERKENEKRLKESFEDRLRVIHESHLIDLKQSAELQKIKISNFEEVESNLRGSKPRRLTSEEMTAREISISAQDKKLKDLQAEVDKQITILEGEKLALQMKIEEFQSRNQRERNDIELASKELKRSTKAFENGRKTWEREKKSEIQYIECRKQELEAVRLSVMEEQRKLAEERFEVASERYKLESMLKLDIGTGKNLIQAKVELKENLEELEKKEKELEKRLEHVKKFEKHVAEEKQKLQEQDDEIKIKSIRAEKMLKAAISKQEEGLKALESAKDIQNKFDKKGNDIQNRLLDIIKREENVVKEETKLATEKDAFNKQRKKLDLVLPQLSADEIHFLNPKLNKYEAEKEVYYKKN